MKRELHLACAQGKLELVWAYLNLGAAVNAYSSSDGVLFETPLHLAARAGHSELVQLLLSWGGNPNLPIRLLVPDPAHHSARSIYLDRLSESGCRARHLAGRAGFLQLAHLLARAEWMSGSREPLVCN